MVLGSRLLVVVFAAEAGGLGEDCAYCCCFFCPEVWGEARGGGWNSDVCFVQIVSCGSLYRDGAVITPEQYHMVDVAVAVVVDVVIVAVAVPATVLAAAVDMMLMMTMVVMLPASSGHDDVGDDDPGDESSVMMTVNPVNRVSARLRCY